MSHSPTPQQQLIYDCVRDSGTNPVVEALAGTGKTTTAVQAAKHHGGGSTGFVAFNKHIATELQRRLGDSAEAKTLHGLGYAAIKKRFRSCQLNEHKLKEITESVAVRAKPQSRYDQKFFTCCREMARFCKYTLTRPEPELIQEMADRYSLEWPRQEADEIAKVVSDILTTCAQRVNEIDFDDMVWFPAVHHMTPRQFDLLMVDEAQDLNRCQQSLAISATRGRLMPIGDARQSLYGFTGSDPSALPSLAKALSEFGGCTSLPLTVTWRCPRSHVRLANRLVPELEAARTATEGKVASIKPSDVSDYVKAGDFILSRTNAPLVRITYSLLLRGCRALMRGRSIGQGLLRLIKELDPQNIDDLAIRLNKFYERERIRLMNRKASAQAIEALEDRVECLSILTSRTNDLNDLMRTCERLFSDSVPTDSTAVVLSSVHRAKGEEAERVFILEPERMPLVWEDQQPWEAQQERNILYVALTRSKSELYFAGELPAILQS